MKYYKIEIDEEVHQYLLSKIEDFGETPNSILRRELFQNKEKKPAVSSSYQFPSLPSGIPTALQHILEVIHFVKKRGLSRIEATKTVSKRHKIRRETVLDKYGRQLGKTTSEVDSLLENQNLTDFKRILINKFPDNKNVIENFFSDLIEPGSANFDHNESKTVSKRGHENRYVSIEVLHTRGEQLVNSKPASVRINETEYEVTSWTEFDEIVIKWFIDNGLLNRSTLPIYATNNKYFINSRPAHKNDSYDGLWNKIDEDVYFDSKFNAPSHIRNVKNLADQLSPNKRCQIKVMLK